MNEARDTYYDVTLARVRPRTVPAALARVEGWLKSHTAGELAGCFFSDLGTVNQILLLRRFDNIGALLDERTKIPLSGDPLGIAEFALELTLDIAVSMPGENTKPAPGPFFEVRTDVLRPGNLDRAITLWQAAASRNAPVFGAYTIAGDRQSVVHIWPCASPDERARLSDDAAPTNIWRPATPDDAPLSQRAEIFRAAAFSPIR